MNQIDWYGARWWGCFWVFETQIPAYSEKWFGSYSQCVEWDSRDWYEF